MQVLSAVAGEVALWEHFGLDVVFAHARVVVLRHCFFADFSPECQIFEEVFGHAFSFVDSCADFGQTCSVYYPLVGVSVYHLFVRMCGEYFDLYDPVVPVCVHDVCLRFFAGVADEIVYPVQLQDFALDSAVGILFEVDWNSLVGLYEMGYSIDHRVW